MTTGINVQPNDVKQICAKVAGLVQQALAVARAVQSMPVPKAAYAKIGGSAASASEQANKAVGQTIQQLSALLNAINANMVSAANQSGSWDASSGQNLTALAQPATAPSTTTTGITTSTTPTPAASLGTAVRAAGAGQLAEPHSVDHVLNTLAPGQTVVPGTAAASPTAFGTWLADPQHRAGLGLTQVGTGSSAAAGVQPGDLVVGAVQGDPIVGIVGDDLNLYNAGPIGPVSALSSVQGVYRPTAPVVMA